MGLGSGGRMAGSMFMNDHRSQRLLAREDWKRFKMDFLLNTRRFDVVARSVAAGLYTLH